MCFPRCKYFLCMGITHISQSGPESPFEKRPISRPEPGNPVRIILQGCIVVVGGAGRLQEGGIDCRGPCFPKAHAIVDPRPFRFACGPRWSRTENSTRP
ncbi:hypothetical protein M413DRAFT_135926 [Hebeloma cylindrosporum]|uniref:Uncharacterized protein n=1 Tax=Hebeloma cylindrosporum TaxID=76867 RepID=A0A0C3BYL4_HEBCY|nr:hypothetical protein M413DRAFT_135926 [Hebeloma cylindrosporum h7]